MIVPVDKVEDVDVIVSTLLLAAKDEDASELADSDVDCVVAASAEVDWTLDVGEAVVLPYPGRYEGEYVKVPEYCGHPGTVVLGGAVPPPQSRKSQSSPVPGTYQARDAPAGEETSVEVQPTRSVRARANEAKEAATRMLEVYILISDIDLVIVGVINSRVVLFCCVWLACETNVWQLPCFYECKRKLIYERKGVEEK